MHVESRALPARAEALETGLTLAVLVLFSLLVRLAVIGATVGFHTPAGAEPASDSRIHAELVTSLLNGRGFSLDGRPTAITPPLYVFVLAGLYGVFESPSAVRVFQALLGSGGVLLLYAIGRRLFDHRAGLIAAIGLSLNPLVTYLGGLHLTENLFLFFVLAVLWQSLNVQDRPTTAAAVGLGVLAGLAALTRSVFLSFLPMVFVWTASLWGIRSGRALRVSAVTLAAAVFVILPWTVRNYVVLGELIPIQSNAGMVFWSGNNAQADGGMVLPTRKTWTAGRAPDDGEYGWRALSTAQENARYTAAAVSWIRGHPGDFLVLLGKKLIRLYGFARATDEEGIPTPALVIVAQFGLYAAATGGLIVSLRHWRRLSMVLGLVVFTNLTVLLFSGATRYLVPMLPSLLLLAGVAVDSAWTRLVPLRGDR